MAKAVAYKPFKSVNDTYQTSVSTNYQKDQTTGQLFKTSGDNVKTIIPEMYKSAVLVYGGTAIKNNTSAKAYTVPAGKVFILCWAQMSACWTNAAAYNDVAEFYADGGGTSLTTFFRVQPSPAVAGQETNTSTPTITMVYPEDCYFEVNSSDVTMYASGRVVGYEIDKSEYLGVFN